MVKNFVSGFLAVFRGMFIIFSSKKMMIIAAAPILVGVIALLGFAGYIIPHYAMIYQYFENFFVQMFGLTAHNFFVQIGLKSLVFLLMIALFFAGVYFLFLTTKLLASPFYGLIADQVFKSRGVKRSDNLSFTRWLYLSFRSTAVNLIEIFVFMIIGVILFIFSFVPVINIFAAFGFFLIMAYDSTDYSLDLLNFKLSERVQYFISHFAQFCGFALAIGLVMFLPVLNLILLASCVAGAADLVGREAGAFKQVQTQ